MKLDLYNNHETYIKESKQNSKINSWFRDIGLTVTDIERHPCIGDLTILVNIRNSFWLLMTNHERGIWSGCWGNVYKYRRFIRPKTLNKLEQLILNMAHREKRLHEQRQRIMALRTEPLKRDQDNEANGSHSHSLHTWTVAYESATDCPYF
jgi:hypothetical protein